MTTDLTRLRYTGELGVISDHARASELRWLRVELIPVSSLRNVSERFSNMRGAGIEPSPRACVWNDVGMH